MPLMTELLGSTTPLVFATTKYILLQKKNIAATLAASAALAQSQGMAQCLLSF